MQVEQNGDGDGEQIRPDRLRRHPDRVIHWERERENEARRGGTVRQSTSKAEHSSGTAFDETELNSTWLDSDGCECTGCWCWCSCCCCDWGDESVDGGDDSLSSFQSSHTLPVSLCLSLCLAAPRRFLIEMFCTIFLRITTCCLCYREAAISQCSLSAGCSVPFPAPAGPSAACNRELGKIVHWLLA